jgi:hypothetical protein
MKCTATLSSAAPVESVTVPLNAGGPLIGSGSTELSLWQDRKTTVRKNAMKIKTLLDVIRNYSPSAIFFLDKMHCATLLNGMPTAAAVRFLFLLINQCKDRECINEMQNQDGRIIGVDRQKSIPFKMPEMRRSQAEKEPSA